VKRRNTTKQYNHYILNKPKQRHTKHTKKQGENKMTLTWSKIQANTTAFSKRWQNAHNEKAQSQTFITALLNAFGIDDPEATGNFEYKIPLTNNTKGYIDYLWKKQIAIEMKSKGKNLKTATKQLQNYLKNLPENETPELYLVSDFENMQLTNQTTKKIYTFKTKDLKKHIKHFANIAGYKPQRIHHDNKNQTQVNIKAAEKMAKLHDALKNNGYTGHHLEVYLCRLLFCLFADDTGIFPQDNFTNYIHNTKPDGTDLSDKLHKLFETLNMPPETRKKRTLLSEELQQFQYINGGLFKEQLPTTEFNQKMRQTLLDCINFNWSKISPAIFGAIFQGVMDKTQRRTLGAHYTSEENILKLINPLFLDELWNEFERVKTSPKALDQFHNKIAKLKFLDPACGCGNFLIITYRELRQLEIAILKMKNNTNQQLLDITHMLKVNVEQFYGIETEEFPCQIATVGMWLIDHQMNIQVSDEFGQYYARLPLKQSATIVHGNALQINWHTVVPIQELSYILGNPPFAGARLMSSEQKKDMTTVFGDKFKGVGNLDYVTAWYKKAADYTVNTNIKCAFVSTNSITQGEQVTLLWKPLMAKGVYINFGIRTFKWSNEAKGKAAVYCVIAGFSHNKTEPNINQYLLEAPSIFIESQSTPLCDVPQMDFGNMPNDAKGLLSNYSTDQKTEIVLAHPETEKWFKKLVGAEEFINNIDRWCLWLKGVSPSEITKSSFLKNVLTKIRDARAKSSREATKKLAETPYLFGEIRQPNAQYIIIPSVSSERRKYVPIGFLSPEVIVNNSVQIIPDASLYHFGVLTSSVHMAWMRAVCGRLKSDYRYSKDIVDVRRYSVGDF